MAQALRMMAVAPSSAQTPPAAMPVQSKRTLADWLDIHAAQVLGQGYKIQTIRNRTVNLKHVRRLWGERPIAELRAHEIITSIRAEFIPHQKSTAQRVLAELRDAYNEAIANDWVQVNPAASIKLPSQRVKRKRLSFETWAKMLTLAQASRQPWLELLLMLALATGQRRGDLVKMRFDDVADGHLHIEQAKQAGKGYGARVAIPLALRCEAMGMTVGQVIDRCRSSGAPGPTMLRKANGGPPEDSSLSIRFAECIRAVLGEGAYASDEWPSLHEVRSLSARVYRAQGVDVQTLLGHKHAEMTALYEDDRGLSAHEYKRLSVGPAVSAHHPG